MAARVTKVAIVQAEVASDLQQGLELTRGKGLEAAEAGAELIVFPETWIPGYPAWLDVCRDAALWDYAPVKQVFAQIAENSVVVPSPSFDHLSETARRCGATLVVGVSERVEQGIGRLTLYNSILTIGPDGRLLNHHRKLMPTYTERLIWGHGDADGLQSVETPAGQVGALICWEHWMPLVRQGMHDSGEDIHVAVWPTVNEMHQIASRHYAFEGRCYVLASGSLMRASSLPSALEPHPDRVHDSNDWVLRGGSAIIGPDGRYVVEPVYERAEILIADLDLSRCREEDMTLDVTGHYQRRDLFEFRIERLQRGGGTASER